MSRTSRLGTLARSQSRQPAEQWRSEQAGVKPTDIDEDGKCRNAQGKGHEKGFSGQAANPVGLATARRNTRADRRPKAWHGVHESAIALTLFGGQCGFFVADEAIAEQRNTDDHDGPSEDGKEKTHGPGHQYVAEIQRIAHVAIGPVG